MCTILLALLFLSQERVPHPKPKTLTVCELLKDVRSYNGKIVAVRGEWSVGEEHNLLQNEGGKPCPQRFVTSGFVWPDAIDLRPGDPEDFPVPFEIDESDIQCMLREAEDRSKTKEDEPAITVATFIGLLITREEFELVKTPGPVVEIRGLGFGHLGAFPAELQYKTLRCVEKKVEKKKVEPKAKPN